MKRKIKRERLDDTTEPRHKRKRLRLPPELAAPRFVELMQEIGSNNHGRRHRAARRLAAHYAVVFKGQSLFRIRPMFNLAHILLLADA